MALLVNEWLSGLLCSDRPVDRVCPHVCMCVRVLKGGLLSFVALSAPGLIGWTHGRMTAISSIHRSIFIPLRVLTHASLQAFRPLVCTHKGAQLNLRHITHIGSVHGGQGILM